LIPPAARRARAAASTYLAAGLTFLVVVALLTVMAIIGWLAEPPQRVHLVPLPTATVDEPV
jgi:hypothetical protein